MPLEDFIIAVLCCVEEMWHESPAPSRLRQRGFAPKLSCHISSTQHNTANRVWSTGCSAECMRKG